jgi:hypothetical protein
MIGYNKIIKASEDVTEEDLMMARVEESFEIKHADNPFLSLILRLVDLLETDSKESQELVTEKGKKVATVTYSVATTTSTEPAESSTTQARFPSSFETPNNKRKISETSFGTRSTETTPNKLVHPEAKVQSLQNTFVNTVIDKLWIGKIGIPWAQGRRMFLTYTEFLILVVYN